MAGISSPSSLIQDGTIRLRNIIASGVSDPVSATRPTSNPDNSRFVNTSYPNRKAYFPLIVVDHEDQSTEPLGIGVNNQIHDLTWRVSVFAKDARTRDVLTDGVVDTLRTIQHSGGAVGTIAGSLHDFRVLNQVKLDEPGTQGIRRKDTVIRYRFYS